jgi:hypothetical protein
MFQRIKRLFSKKQQVPQVLKDKIKQRLELIFEIEASNLLIPIHLEGRVRKVFLPLDFCKYRPFQLALHFAQNFPEDTRYLNIEEEGGNRIGYSMLIASKEFLDDVICEIPLYQSH